MMTEQEFNRIFAKANELWESDFFQKHGSAAIERYLDIVGSEFKCRLHSALRDLESPIEAAFFAWWQVRTAQLMTFYLRPQSAVVVGGRPYRLDFVVRPCTDGLLAEMADAPDCPLIAIELDGHDFHEKTKEQVTYRNRRDRDLQAAGWIVLHVSGSEFNANPETVTEEMYQRVADVMYAAYHRRAAQTAREGTGELHPERS